MFAYLDVYSTRTYIRRAINVHWLNIVYILYGMWFGLYSSQHTHTQIVTFGPISFRMQEFLYFFLLCVAYGFLRVDKKIINLQNFAYFPEKRKKSKEPQMLATHTKHTHTHNMTNFCNFFFFTFLFRFFFVHFSRWCCVLVVLVLCILYISV